MKSGGLKYHGQVSDFIRNTAFDAWRLRHQGTDHQERRRRHRPAPKPVDHQNELSASFGGHVPAHQTRSSSSSPTTSSTTAAAPTPPRFTVPTALERHGDFTELNGGRRQHGGLTGHRRQQSRLPLRSHHQHLHRRHLHPHALPGYEERHPHLQRHPGQLHLAHHAWRCRRSSPPPPIRHPDQQLHRRHPQRFRQPRPSTTASTTTSTRSIASPPSARWARSTTSTTIRQLPYLAPALHRRHLANIFPKVFDVEEPTPSPTPW